MQNKKTRNPREVRQENQKPKNESPKFEKRSGPSRSTNNAAHSKKFPAGHIAEGLLRITGKGLGLVFVDGMDDPIEIDPTDLRCALHGDRVEVTLFGRSAGRRPTGAVKKILLREHTAFAGVLSTEGGAHFLIADDTRMYKPILIPEHALLGAKKGDKVFGEITIWEDPEKDPLGEIRQILGKPGDNDAEMHAIAMEAGFMPNHDADVLAAAEAISAEISNDEIAKRRDFRGITTFTIDPHDAKDFDDALSFQVLPSGNVEVGVHIADVSHYVTPGSVIDKEAFERATSVYLVDRTIPMLPERLSNELCSLVPHKDRLTMSAVFELDKNARVVKEWFGKTIIHSVRRFTYEEAQAVIETGRGDHAQELSTMNALAKKLLSERLQNGAIAFEAQEVKFELDERGRPISVYTKVMKDANKLIEEYMLLANKRVATFLAESDPKTTKAFVYRVHDIPNEERMQDLADFLDTLGVRLARSKKTGQWDSRDINRMLSDVAHRAEAAMIQMATVRSMAKAIYTTKNIGHYGLGFEFYTHFTSPIRRYPDLMVHRLLQAELMGEKVPLKVLEKQEHLARYCSQMEVEATGAERESIKLKQCEYFAERVGTAIDGTISGVTEWGLYVEDNLTKAEGLIHIKDLPNDFFFFEEKNYRLVGRNTKATFRLGDPIKAEITGVDMRKRQLSMRLLAHRSMSALAGPIVNAQKKSRREENGVSRKPAVFQRPQGAAHSFAENPRSRKPFSRTPKASKSKQQFTTKPEGRNRTQRPGK